MTEDLLAAVPARHGHFVLESGFHTDVWLTLDALFTDPGRVGPAVSALAAKLRPYDVAGVCGPLLGGAFLALAVSTQMNIEFYYSEQAVPRQPGLFTAEYRLPWELTRRVRGRRVAVVDDVISMGSSVNATITALRGAEASVAVVGALMVLGERGVSRVAAEGLPLETLGRRDFRAWNSWDCPLCVEGKPLVDPYDA